MMDCGSLPVATAPGLPAPSVRPRFPLEFPLMRLGLALLLILSAASFASAQQVKRSDLKPGLVLTVGDMGRVSVTRLEPTVALTLNPGEAAHPRSAGGSTFTWTGYIQVITAGKYTFDAE